MPPASLRVRGEQAHHVGLQAWHAVATNPATCFACSDAVFLCLHVLVSVPLRPLQDELADMADLTNEINEAMGQSYAIPDDVDEADLMAELDALEGDLALDETLGASGPSYLQVITKRIAAHSPLTTSAYNTSGY